MSKDNGGPAFPVEGGAKFVTGNAVHKTLPSNGMTLRDYFAAKALSGMLADRANIERFDAIGSKELVEPEALMATAAYQMADMMLLERAK